MAVLAVVQVDSLKHRCDDLIRPIGWTGRNRGDTSFERMDTARFSPYHVGRSLILRRVGDPHMEASGPRSAPRRAELLTDAIRATNNGVGAVPRINTDRRTAAEPCLPGVGPAIRAHRSIVTTEAARTEGSRSARATP